MVEPNIVIISASAGSGKTYTLAEELKRALDASDDPPRGERARPEAVLATTFTRKAASELRERARRALVQAGRVADARRLASARIGTVNAVCGRLVAEGAFELELSPRLRVMDQRASSVALARAITLATTEERTARLEAIRQRFPNNYLLPKWTDYVNQIVNEARTNGLTPSDLDDSCARSWAEVRQLLDVEDEDDLDALLLTGLRRFLADERTLADSTKTTRTAVGECRTVLADLERGRTPRWPQWDKLSKPQTATKAAPAFEEHVIAVASRHLSHGRLHRDLKEYGELLYAIARDTMSEYDRSKRQWGTLDFTDQERLCLDLLQSESGRERLRGSLDLVLVDEFQDTSPLQLAIFTRLSELAPLSVWVGDQKQSIFSFRGTSPDLMNMAVDQFAPSGPDKLPKSYRSRPELVELTSALFATAFANHGVPREFVELSPAREEKVDLGPVVEWWRWGSSEGIKNREGDVLALASGVLELLADPAVLVKDPLTDEVRHVLAGDIAVLCRTNDVASLVADGLASAGVRAVIPRSGLLDTLEGRVVLAGLQLWVDPYDRLAQATVDRLVGFPADGALWLDSLMSRLAPASSDEAASSAVPPDPSIEVPADSDAANRLAAARGARPFAGAAEALDLVVDALGVREIALAWGDEAQRLANVEALRALAVRYTTDQLQLGGGPTPAGFVRYLLDLRVEGEDAQAVVQAEDAVVVATWHQAKGLEWPITVLFHLDYFREDPPLGVTVASEVPHFSQEDPLAGRWVRFWPNPMESASEGEYYEAVEGHAVTQPFRSRQKEEALRLLYVGWTRARDRVVLAARDGQASKGILLGLVDGDGRALIDVPTDDTVWAGCPVRAVVRSLAKADHVPVPTTPGEGYAAPRAVPHPPARVAASALDFAGIAGNPISLGPRLVVRDPVSMDRLGSAVHGFLAADRLQLPRQTRLAEARALLAAWGVADALGPEDVVLASDRLAAWVQSEWPDAVWRREWPLARRLAAGTAVVGTADLVLELPDRGFVLIDHKTFPGSEDDAAERAAKFAGQLGAYADALGEATGRVVEAAYIHLPVLGMVVPVEPVAPAGIPAEPVPAPLPAHPTPSLPGQAQ